MSNDLNSRKPIVTGGRAQALCNDLAVPLEARWFGVALVTLAGPAERLGLDPGVADRGVWGSVSNRRSGS